jgi:aerobic carbon-monoxide dehydrogenase medium subunit
VGDVKAAPFDYHAPSTVEETVALLHELGEDAKVLAGGQSLIPMLNLRLARFGALIDIGRVGSLRHIERTDHEVVVGATVRQSTLEVSEVIGRDVPLVAAATQLIGHFQIRNRGTIGGSLAHADPAAEYPAVALALDAEIDMTGPGGTRSVPADAFFAGTWETALAPDELLTAVRFPAWGQQAGFAVEEVARRYGDFAMAGCACGVELDEDQIRRAAIALFGVAGTPVRATAAEEAITDADGAGVDPTEVGRLAAEGLEPPDDIHASGALRRRIAGAVVRRALQRALESASSTVGSRRE